jgi:hypothetical protein
MSTSRDPDRLIHSFLREGEDELFDQVYDRVRAGIDNQPQRVVIGPWRMPIMNKIVGYGLAAAAVVAAVLIGIQLIGSSSGGIGAGPTPTTTAEPTPTPVPSLAEPSSAPDSLLPEGPFLVQDSGALPEAPGITVMIGAPGWTSLPEFGGLTKGPDTDPPQSAILLWAWPVGTAFDVYGDPCQWESTTPDTPVTTADDIAAALAAQASRDASDPIDVAIGGHQGKKVTLHVPTDAAFEDCDDTSFASYGVAGTRDPSRTHQGPGQVDEIWILNVNGGVAILDVMYHADTPAAVIDEMRAIVESATFEAP